MTIDKAIETLKHTYLFPGDPSMADFTAALKLGIEALRRLKEHREEHIDIGFRYLPGETSE